MSPLEPTRPASGDGGGGHGGARAERGGVTGIAALELAMYRAAGWVYTAVLLVMRSFTSPSSPRRQLVEERLGRWPDPAAPESPRVWIHAASVGEVLVARPLAVALRERRPDLRVLMTCNTPTGREMAASLPVEEVRYLPADSPPVLDRVLATVRPRLFVFVETEIWPGLLLALSSRGIPSIMVNARVSERSFPRYRRVAPLMRAALSTVAAVCARDGESQRRLIALGAEPARSTLTGDLKLDAIDARDVELAPRLLAFLPHGAPVLVAASTHEGEERMVLEAYSTARGGCSELRLVLAPRHPARAGDLDELVQSLGLRSRRWTRLGAATDWDVLVVDTVGELRGFLRSAVGAFVGGSLVPLGGHNVLEPAAYGVPVVTGPHLANVAEQAAAMRDAGVLVVVHDASELAGVWRRWLEDRRGSTDLGNRARAFVEANGGALERTWSVLVRLLPAVGVDGPPVVTEGSSAERVSESTR